MADAMSSAELEQLQEDLADAEQSLAAAQEHYETVLYHAFAQIPRINAAVASLRLQKLHTLASHYQDGSYEP